MAIGSVVIDLLMRTGSFVTDTERANKQLKKLKQSAKETDSSLSELGKVFGTLSGPLKVFGASLAAAFSAHEIVRMAQEMDVLSGRIKMATSNLYEHSQAMRAVNDIANKNYSSLSAVADLYISNERALSQLGKTQDEVFRFTENLTMAMRAGGGSAAAQSAAITQLGQALASGVLRGDEFNSVAEQAPMIMQLLAESLGVTTGQLREMASEGKITADVLYNALGNSDVTKKLEASLANLPITVENAWQRMMNVISGVVADINQASGATSTLANGIVWLSEEIEASASNIENTIGDVKFFFAEIGSLVDDAIATVDDFLASFGTSTGELADKFVDSTSIMQKSFAEFAFESIDRAEDFLNFIYGAASGISSAFEALTGNIIAYFNNAWASVKSGAASALNSVIDTINAVSNFVGGGSIAHIKVDAGDASKQIKNVFDELSKGYDLGKNTFDFAKRLKNRYALNVLDRQSEKIYEDYAGVGETLYNKREATPVQPSSSKKSSKRGASSSKRVSEEQRAWEKMQKTIERAKLAADEYLSTMDKNYERTLQAFGLGEREREKIEAMNKIAEDYQQKIFDLNNTYANTARDEGYYEQVKILQETYDSALEKARNFYDQEDRLRGNWQLGFSSALKDYADQASNIYDNIQGVVANAFSGMEDALLDFVMTGKANFKDLANSIIRDLVRIYIQQQITGLFANVIGGLFSGGSFSGIGNVGHSFTVGGAAPTGLTSIGPKIALATGGLVTGPGTATSDSIPAMLSNGEYVINAKATSQHFALLEAINKGRTPVYRASGGVVGSPPRIPTVSGLQAMVAPTGSVTVNITNHSSQPVGGNARMSTDSMGNMVVDVMLEDLNKNGRYTQQLKSMMGR